MTEQRRHDGSFGTLYIVATPIGNLEDMTFRALSILKDVDRILAEDTRHSQRLLSHYAVTTSMQSLHDHNEREQVPQLIERLKQGERMALISDAGTPLISDPGYRLVKAAHQAAISVVPVPGACALIAGLSASGLPTDHFVFEGFLPQKGAVREKRLRALEKETRTIVLYESVHRIVNLIELMCNVLGEAREVTLARELTKTFETIYHGTLGQTRDWLSADANQQKGEFVVMAKGYVASVSHEAAETHRELITVLLSELSVKQTVSLATKITGAPRKLLYALALDVSKESMG